MRRLITKVVRYWARERSVVGIEQRLQDLAWNQAVEIIEENRSRACDFYNSVEGIRSVAFSQIPSSGLLFEFGVNRGRSINYFSRLLDKSNDPRIIVGFDNFLYNQGPYVYDVLTRRYSCTLYQEELLSFSDNLRKCIKEADVIIPLAAIVGAPICDKMPQYATDINYKWYERLLAEPNIEKKLIIYPNTNSGYGTTGTDICTEETPCNPISLYGQTKKDTEDLLLNDHPNSICFRLATVFGWFSDFAGGWSQTLHDLISAKFSKYRHTISAKICAFLDESVSQLRTLALQKHCLTVLESQ